MFRSAFVVLLICIFAGLWRHELQLGKSTVASRNKDRESRCTIGSKAVWGNWIGQFACPAGMQVSQPSDIAELQKVVKDSLSVRAVATGHSFNLFGCPRGSPGQGAIVDMRQFTKTVVDVKTHTVWAEAGLTMGQLMNDIGHYGLTMRVPPGNSAFTVGGCVVTGCHNLGRSLSSDVLELAIVTHDGTIKTVTSKDKDFPAAAVMVGRLGVLWKAKIQLLPHRSMRWATYHSDLPAASVLVQKMADFAMRLGEPQAIIDKLVIFVMSGKMVQEHWAHAGGDEDYDAKSTFDMPAYENSQMFRIGQGGVVSSYIAASQTAMFSLMPDWFTIRFQGIAEHLFRLLHTSESLGFVRAILGWQHSPDGRGEVHKQPKGYLYTWAGWLDEIVNLFMGLQHVEVIFPLYPLSSSQQCVETVLKYKHLAWWRLNIRAMNSEPFWLSSVHGSQTPGANASSNAFLRVDFVTPQRLLQANEQALTKELHERCPGWRKHWGKSLFTHDPSNQGWGNGAKFAEVAKRYDPSGKFCPRDLPGWVAVAMGC